MVGDVVVVAVKRAVVVLRCEVVAVVGGVGLVGICRFGDVVRLVVLCGSADVVGVARQVVGMRVAWCGVARGVGVEYVG